MTRMMTVNRFAHTGGELYALRHLWPEGCLVQGGHSGVVLGGPEGSYRTAYFEAFPDGTFIRGQGDTLEDAEDAAWARYETQSACAHENWQPHPPGRPSNLYENGGGFCQECGRFESNRFTGEELGQLCVVCGAGTTWERYGPNTTWDESTIMGVVDPSPEEERDWYCEEHAPFRAERLVRRREMERLIALLGDDDDD